MSSSVETIEEEECVIVSLRTENVKGITLKI